MLPELCHNLKNLERLEAQYETCALSNVSILSQLKNLKHLKLMNDLVTDESVVDEAMNNFNETFFQVLPTLKTYKCTEEDLDGDYNDNSTLSNVQNLTPCALEQCKLEEITSEEDM